MADHKTEQPTPRRRQKAREEGKVARSRELSSAAAICAALVVLGWRAPIEIRIWGSEMRSWLDDAGRGGLLSTSLLFRTSLATLRFAVPPAAAAWFVALGVSFAQGGPIWAPEALTFHFERLQPSAKLQQLFSIQAIAGLLRSLVPATVICYLVGSVIAREWSALIGTSFSAGPQFTKWLFGLAAEIAWKCALVMLIWSLADYLLVRYQLESGLKMSREEVRQEHREMEGDPLVKARIRRLQRQVRRRKMLQDVEHAAVVIANPTHYAIALAYDSEMPAPVVVAKGRDHLALQIKDAARWHEVAVVENPPLAHALYRAVPVGSAIPSKLYTAVAEILAFVYRAQARALAGRNS